MNNPNHDYWRAALAGEKPAVHENSPQLGYYRTKGGKGRTREPVAIFEDGGALVALKSEQPVDPFEIWTWVCMNPVSYEAYVAVAENGASWPDMDETVAEQIGHNSGAVDEAELIREQIEAAKAGAGEYAKIGDDETAAKAQSLRSRLLELKGQAEKAHKAEKEPHLKAGREVDQKWLPVAKDAGTAADGIRSALTAYENAKLAAERVRQQKAAEEAAKAEAGGKPVAPPPATETTAPIKGAYGRAASVRTVAVVTVVDQDALYVSLRDHPDVKQLLVKLAQRVADNTGLPAAGCTIEQVRKVA